MDEGDQRRYLPIDIEHLRAENARLQEQVGEHMQRRAEAEEEARRLQMCEGMARDMAEERDGYKALAKVRGEALEAIIEARDAFHGGDLKRAIDKSRVAIAMTPEEAGKKKERQGE